MFSQGTYVIDGCAIFFKKDRFTLIKKYEVEFNKAALSLVESLGGASQKKDALNRLMKDNVALIVVLEALEQPGVQAPQGKRQLLCVANTHIHANTAGGRDATPHSHHHTFTPPSRITLPESSSRESPNVITGLCENHRVTCTYLRLLRRMTSHA